MGNYELNSGMQNFEREPSVLLIPESRGNFTEVPVEDLWEILSDAMHWQPEPTKEEGEL